MSRSVRQTQAKMMGTIGHVGVVLMVLLAIALASPHRGEAHLSAEDGAVVVSDGAPVDASAVLAAECHASATCHAALVEGSFDEAGETAPDHAATRVPRLGLEHLSAGPFRPPRTSSLV